MATPLSGTRPPFCLEISNQSVNIRLLHCSQAATKTNEQAAMLNSQEWTIFKNAMQNSTRTNFSSRPTKQTLLGLTYTLMCLII